jgi:hypothetical protein
MLDPFLVVFDPCTCRMSSIAAPASKPPLSATGDMVDAHTGLPEPSATTVGRANGSAGATIRADCIEQDKMK